MCCVAVVCCSRPIHTPKSPIYTQKRAQYTLKRILYTLQRTCYKLKRALYIPVHTKKSLIHTQKSPSHTQKSPIRVQHRNVEQEQSEETLMGGTHCNILQHTATYCNSLYHVCRKNGEPGQSEEAKHRKALYTLECPLYTHQSRIHT